MARMGLPVLDKFCFVFDLRKGCIYMGIVNSVLTFGLAASMIPFAVELKDAAEAMQKRDDMEASVSIVYSIVVLLDILLFIKFLIDLIFAYALYKEKCGIIKKYCICWTVFLVLFIIGFLKSMFQMEALYVIAHILFIAENFYFLTVTRSYLISINEDGVL